MHEKKTVANVHEQSDLEHVKALLSSRAIKIKDRTLRTVLKNGNDEELKIYLKNCKSIERMHIVNKASQNGWLNYTDFYNYMTDILISETGYATDCGSNANVAAVIVIMLEEKIKKHPLLWKLFFMLA